VDRDPSTIGHGPPPATAAVRVFRHCTHFGVFRACRRSKLQDLDVLGRVHFHQLHEQVPQSPCPLTSRNSLDKRRSSLASACSRSSKLVSQFDDAVATDAEGFRSRGIAGCSGRNSASVLSAAAKSRNTRW